MYFTEGDCTKVIPDLGDIKKHLKDLKLTKDMSIICYDAINKDKGAYIAAFWCRLYGIKDVTVLKRP